MSLTSHTDFILHSFLTRGLVHRLLALLSILLFYYYEMTRVQHSKITPTILVTTKSLKRSHRLEIKSKVSPKQKKTKNCSLNSFQSAKKNVDRERKKKRREGRKEWRES